MKKTNNISWVLGDRNGKTKDFPEERKINLKETVLK